MSALLPSNAFDLVPQPPPDAADRRTVELLGASVELISAPNRGQRAGAPAFDRPPFQANRADAILAAESVWEADGMHLTGNAFPFANPQLLLWSATRSREPNRAMLEVAFEFEDRQGGSSMVNSIGASGSVTRSHMHLLARGFGFLSQLPHKRLDPGLVHLHADELTDCELVQLVSPFPGIAIGIRGPAQARARAMHHLLECRTSLAFNIVSTNGCAWLFPRTSVEIPSPHFPQALGGAELAGLWVVNDPTLFETLTPDQMGAAISMACQPRPSDFES